MHLSTIVGQLLNENFLNEGKPRVSPEAWETQFFLSLENEWDLPLATLTADSKSRLDLAYQFAKKYLAFHYRYRRRLTENATFNLFDTNDVVFTKIDDEHRHSPIEWMGIIPVYPNGHLGDFSVVQYGTANRVQIDPIELFALVLRLRPLGFYLIHNHPSGDLTASREDIELTDRVAHACEAVGLKFFGHAIVSSVGETWICDISPSHGSYPARKPKARLHPATSSGAR